MYIMQWEWDDAKNVANTEKHGVSFEEALQVFTDPSGIEKEDLTHFNTKREAVMANWKAQKRPNCNRGLYASRR